jgi:phenylalanyl-tRNA synthetase alpha chain
MKQGHLHPITQMIREIISVFIPMGFEVATGPELETEWYNFDALNIPKDHPARDMQDTFWIKDKGEKKDRLVLRTHTSPVQIRYLEENKNNLPCRIIVPGKVFRNEATDATHEAQFFQLEGLVVDKDISLAHLKWTLTEMMKRLYGPDAEIRFRPSFFAFVEPGVEVDMKYITKDGEEKWLEMGGAGLVHPNVLKSAGVDPSVWSGFAFGFGVDRLVMRQRGIDDVRRLYQGDLRFINQF